tara:strand:+ start:118 stop:528 length:411 start_codon:yes stop_codon:yes gene_type:complete
MKECYTCKETKSYANFYKVAANNDGHSGVCGSCKLAYNQNYKKVNKDRVRDAYLRKTYGVSLIEVNKLFAEQEGRCDICGIHEKHCKHQRLGVDHDHDSGAVRGLLCANCNTGIGLLQDSSEFTQKATAYLAKHGK